MVVPGARRTASALVLATGFVHLALVPTYGTEAMYLGVLFLIAGLLAVAVGAGLWRFEDRTFWWAGLLLCAGMVIGFIVSRTVGLPAYKASGASPVALFSLAAESGFLLLALVSLRGSASPAIPAGRSNGQAPPLGRSRSSAVMAHGPQLQPVPPAPPRCSQRHRDTVAGHEPSLPQ